MDTNRKPSSRQGNSKVLLLSLKLHAHTIQTMSNWLVLKKGIGGWMSDWWRIWGSPSQKYMTHSLFVGLYGAFANPPFLACTVYFDPG